MSYDVIILGAGIAGLAAARTCAEAGKRVLVMEAEHQVGGRMRTLHPPGALGPVELGAEFIHGRPPDLLALLEEAKLETCEGEGEQLCFTDNAVSECPEDDGMWALLDGMQAAADDAGDMSFNAYLARSSASEAAKTRARSYVEGFNAADSDEIGILGLARQQAAEDAIEGHRSARVTRGYQALAEYVRDRALAAGATVLLGTPIARVHWQAGRCIVYDEGGQQWSAAQIICALPLGVLQSRSVVIESLPLETTNALSSLRAGKVQRIVFEFAERWWAGEHARMHFLFAPPCHPPVWWTTLPRQSPLLTGWIGGPGTRRTPDRATLESEALRSLEQIFARPVKPLLTAAHMLDWNTHLYSLGAYSYAPAGAADAAKVLAIPISGTLFFAGEHTDTTGHPGTVHGALRSGLRAAQQALSAPSLLQA